MYTIGLIGILGCLPKYMGNKCLNQGHCDDFNVVEQSSPSETPFEISRDDIVNESQVSNFQLTDRGLLAETETREACRALHLGSKTYALTLEKWYHKPFKGYRLTEDVFTNGDYQPCSDWEIESTSDVAIYNTSVDNTTLLTPLQRSGDNVLFPLSSLGIGMLQNPEEPTLQVTIEQVQNRADKQKPIDVLLPERNGDWLCQVIPTIDRIVAAEHYSTWKILVNVNGGKAAFGYLHNDEPRLLHLQNEIQSCVPATQRYLQGIIRAAANEHADSYGHLNYLYSGLFGKKLTGVRRTGTAKKSTTGTSSKRRSGSIVGTYQCKHNGEMAYMRIYRNGVFSLKLELKSGSAQGVCSGSRCTVENINNNAVAFTDSVNQFSVKRSGNSLFINNKVRCEKKS